MGDKQQGAIAAVLIAFFIFMAVAVTTPALSSNISLPQDQQKIMTENETASNDTTTIDNNNTG
ncbi:MAG: hypothetical protein AB7V56_09550 [Candidatus Nitrosocosmicus sp.]|jgi:hypothetical protein|uniref:hypothetical protein n=1 Tax=Candidatus Nitrosocosmicus agrestis TaxID=2563600 RepID=UPI00122DDE6A|nr:hypothetical protein [Candidatus Nitrosocosmicus sp. SS]KAA2279139.1 hypothetical protein F1Z66_14075 [Candidatus Nitrosocosmicus sp. SS]KAF0867677.1 hypothetical protein E5N71_14150 [Candidatus Nitrosocosmicus sp. SS]MDR4491238.1 hypothetical protein [Candidatus Nitrosocosmicus sp.]HET6589836.1 hypothetical protein [Candidatus Nitrosocosmicus sp.]